jgi:hypothetical protein
MSKHWDERVTGCDSTLPNDPLNVDEKIKCRETFEKYDKDQSGMLDQEEFKLVLGELNIRFDDPEMEAAWINDTWEAADSSDDDKVDYNEFIAMYKKIFAPANRHGTKLRKACGRGNPEDLELIRELIGRGCHANLTDGAGFTTLHHAAEYGRTSVVQLLSDLLGKDTFGSFLDVQDQSGWSALMNAASHGHVETCQLLVNLGADVNLKSKQGRTALHWAASKGREQVVDFLLSKGMKAEDTDNVGWTALHCATMANKPEVAKKLITKSKKSGDSMDYCGYNYQRYADETFAKEMAAKKKSKKKA